MLSNEAIILIRVFSLVLITMLIYLWMKICGKEIKIWFKIIMFFVLLTGVRHLNYLRWPDTVIRERILNQYTPIGMSGEDVFQRVDNMPLWTRREPPRYVYFEPGIIGIRATLGIYRMFFIFGMHVEAGWHFDENGYLTDVVVFRGLDI